MVMPSEGDPETYGDPSLKHCVWSTFPAFPRVFFGIPTQNLNESEDFSQAAANRAAALVLLAVVAVPLAEAADGSEEEDSAEVVVVVVVVSVMEELALLVTAKRERGGGRGSPVVGVWAEKFTTGEDVVEEEPERTGVEATALETDAALTVVAEDVCGIVAELCESFPERRMSFVILMLHMRDTMFDCWKSPTMPFTLKATTKQKNRYKKKSNKVKWLRCGIVVSCVCSCV